MSTPMWDLPEHLLIPVNERGEGPVPEAEAHRWMCWCSNGDRCDERGAAMGEAKVRWHYHYEGDEDWRKGRPCNNPACPPWLEEAPDPQGGQR